jgi:hypothetical protein
VRLTLGDESEELVLKIASNPRPTAAPGAPTTAAGVAAAPGAVQPATAQAAAPAALPAAAATSLAERRRAARAAAEAAGTPPAGTPPPQPGTADPRWNALDQAYRDRASRAANRGATK